MGGLRLGSVLAGAGYAIRSGTKTMRDLDQMERDRAREKRDAETHETAQRSARARASSDEITARRAKEDDDLEKAAREAAKKAAEEPVATPGSEPAAAAGTTQAPVAESRPVDFPAAPASRTLDAADPAAASPAPVPMAAAEPASAAPAAAPVDPGPAPNARQPLGTANPGDAVARPIGTAPAQPPAAVPLTMADASAGSPAAAPAATASPAGASSLMSGEQGGTPANVPLWLRTAKAQADVYMKAGRTDRAQRLVTDAISNQIGQLEAQYKYETLPKIEEIRRKGLANDELARDQTYNDLRLKAQRQELEVSGLMWGLVMTGNQAAALKAFNASGMARPGVTAESIGVTEGPMDPRTGKPTEMIALLDKNGRPVAGKDGKAIMWPRSTLDQLWRQTATGTLTLNKGQSVIQTRRNPDGTVSTTPVFTAPDPEETRKNAREDRAQATADRAATTAETTRKDRLRGQARDAVKNQLFAGQTLMDKVDPIKQEIHGRAAPLAEKYVDQDVPPADAANRAVKEVQDLIKREKSGAGGTGSPANAPSWKDMLN